MKNAFILYITAILLPAHSIAQSGEIEAAVARYAAETIEFRHFVHQYPELGNREFETSRRVAEHMRELGLEVRTGIAHTGVVGILRGGSGFDRRPPGAGQYLEQVVRVVRRRDSAVCRLDAGIEPNQRV